jgi:glycerate 2-kinase
MAGTGRRKPGGFQAGAFQPPATHQSNNDEAQAICSSRFSSIRTYTWMSLRDDAIAIWKAGVAAVDSCAAVLRTVMVEDSILRIGSFSTDLRSVGRVEVVGAGKAGAGMAEGVEKALRPCLRSDQLSGWVNVPADCVRPLQRIHLHAARPAGVNEPTEQGVDGTREILARVSSLQPNDVCLVLISGGASALLCSPADGISLQDKLIVTRLLAAAGTPIHDLNLVRTELSHVKGGRLATACRAGAMVALIISDVIGDPLEVIGSGPTVPAKSRPQQALEILRQRIEFQKVPQPVVQFLETLSEKPVVEADVRSAVTNLLVASNRTAVEAAALHAQSMGYEVIDLGSADAGEASVRGQWLTQLAHEHAASSCHQARVCLLSGGEPTVNIGKNAPGRGGRNQEFVLGAIAGFADPLQWQNMTLLAGGTDGEDGPTDAAGAFADYQLVKTAAAMKLHADEFLKRHDSYSYFERIHGLLKTGPTHTNVMDLRVCLYDASGGDN